MQAILILAHTAPEHVFRLAKHLHSKFEIYIHFDKKFPLSEEMLAKMKKEGLFVYREFEVSWGGWSIGAAEEFLMEEALKNPNIQYFHVISGQDWPTLSPQAIYDFYENKTSLYLECYPARGVKKSGEPILWWQKFYFPYDKMNRRTTYGKIYHRFSLLAQATLGINKFKRYQFEKEIYHGAVWTDLPRDAVEYLISYWNAHPEVQKIFQTGFCPDEFWAQTILYHSPFQNRIDQNFHRYVLWEKRFGSYPAILDERDFDEIVKSGAHFARKIVPEHSENLIQKLEK